MEPVGANYPKLNEKGIPRFAGQVRFTIGSESDFFLKGIYFSNTPIISFGVGADYQPNAVLKLAIPNDDPMLSSADADFRYASPMDARRRMVAEQIRARGVVDRRVLDAMEKVPPRALHPGGSPRRSPRGSAGPDRVRRHHLAALHRRLHDRGAEGRGVTPRARDRHGVRLPDGGARGAGRARLLDRTDPRAGGARAA